MLNAKGTTAINTLIVSTAGEAMAPHSSTLAWRIPWTVEPGGLQSMGSRRVGHDGVINTHTYSDSVMGEEKGTLTCFFSPRVAVGYFCCFGLVHFSPAPRPGASVEVGTSGCFKTHLALLIQSISTS